MNSKQRQTTIIIAAISASLALIVLLWAARPAALRAVGTYTLSRPNISAGYSLSQSASYRVGATGGEVDAGAPQSGGNLGVTGGFWAGVEEPPPLPPPAVQQYGLYLPIAVGK